MIGGINMVVAFTGYRPEKMPFVESKKDEAYLKFRKILCRYDQALRRSKAS